MPITALACPNCGAPVAPRLGGTVTCAYCQRTLTGVPEATWASLLAAPDEERDLAGHITVRVGGVRYAVRGLLGRGARAEVLLAERLRRPAELVVLKVLRGSSPAAHASARRELSMLRALAKQGTPGAAFFTTLIPQPVAEGTLVSRDLPERPAVVVRWRSGFQHSLREVRDAYPGGVDGRTVVWMWRRVLELLAWLHASDVTHGAIRAEHVLVHPRDHGALLVGWSEAAFHEAGFHEAGHRAKDLRMTARTIRQVADEPCLPTPLRALLARTAADDSDAVDAGALAKTVLSLATRAYGAPAFHPFTMPGWA